MTECFRCGSETEDHALTGRRLEEFALWYYFTYEKRTEGYCDCKFVSKWLKIKKEQSAARSELRKVEKKNVEAELERTGGSIKEGDIELAYQLRGANDRIMEWKVVMDLTAKRCPICPRTFERDNEGIMHHLIQWHEILLDQSDPYSHIVYGIMQCVIMYERNKNNGMGRRTREVHNRRIRRSQAVYRLIKDYGIPLVRVARLFDLDVATIAKMSYTGLMHCHGCKDWMTNSI